MRGHGHRLESKCQLPGKPSLTHTRVPGRASIIPTHHPGPQTPAARAAHRHSTPLCTCLTGRLACRQVCSTWTGRRSCCTWSWALIPAAIDIYSSRTLPWWTRFCALRSLSSLRLRDRRKGRLGECGRAGSREHRTAFCGHVGPLFIDLYGGDMLYDVCGGQGRRNPGLVCALGSSRSH